LQKREADRKRVERGCRIPRERRRMGIRISNPGKRIEYRKEALLEDLKDETFESQELFRRAEACIVRGRFNRAEALLADALMISSTNPLYLSYYGLCVGMRGELPEAQRLCSKAAKLSPQSPIVLVNLGRILLAQGLRKEARDFFSRAYEIDNTNAPAALELSGMGVRRQPVLRRLPRSHPLNKMLGRMRHRILGYKKPGLKKR
jgi:Flp pilus assembly protein TadD